MNGNILRVIGLLLFVSCRILQITLTLAVTLSYVCCLCQVPSIKRNSGASSNNNNKVIPGIIKQTARSLVESNRARLPWWNADIDGIYEYKPLFAKKTTKKKKKGKPTRKPADIPTKEKAPSKGKKEDD